MRQGDPISPYLFVLIMEVFNGIMRRKVEENRLNFHPKWGQMQLCHLAFADDLLLFGRADDRTAVGMREGLMVLQQLSGLRVSKEKSQVFFGGCSKNIKRDILNTLGFVEWKLPIKYLGLPVVSTLLKHKHCQPLLEKLSVKIHQWHNKTLSFAGKVQLIKTVVGGLINFWTMPFPLPLETIKQVNSMLANFLWSSMGQRNPMHKVKWDACCLPLDQGGLGICNIELRGKVAAFKNMWELLSGVSNIWSEWIEHHHLKGKSLWLVHQKESDSWHWKYILECRGEFQNHLRKVIGNGNSTSL